jgi:tripartite-type tricarboxylate transporter receptor subunit TctC
MQSVLRAAFLLGMLLLGPTSGAQAQLAPDKPIRFIVPFGAGSSGDLAARTLGLEISELAGVPVLVENVAGADGIIGTRVVKSAAPDGNTLLIASSSQQVLNPLLYKQPGYDPLRDFEAVAPIMTAPLQVYVRSDSRLTNVADIIQAGRRGEGSISYGGATGTQRLAAEMFNQMAGIRMLYVPYRTTVAALTDLAAGRVDVVITEAASAAPFRSKVKPLATVLGKRMRSMPDLPTVAEAGDLKGYNITAFYGVWAPAGTPAPVVLRLADLIAKARKSQRMKDLFAAIAGEPFELGPAEFRRFQASQLESLGRVVQRAGIEAQ